MVIDIKKFAVMNKVETDDLITRPVGRLLFKKLSLKLGELQDGEVVLINFKGIRVIDSSFIDEFLVALILQSMKNDFKFFVKLKNFTTIIEINIESVFNSYSNFKRQNIAVITEDICQNNHFFIGAIEPTCQDILEYIRVNKNVTLEDISHFIGKPLDTLKETIEKLFLMRLIRKVDINNYAAV